MKKSWLKLKESDIINRDTSIKDKETDVIKSDKVEMKSSKNMRIRAIITWQHKYNIQTAGAVRSSLPDNKLKHSHLIKTNFTVVQKKAATEYSSNSATKKAQLKWWVR